MAEGRKERITQESKLARLAGNTTAELRNLFVSKLNVSPATSSPPLRFKKSHKQQSALARLPVGHLFVLLFFLVVSVYSFEISVTSLQHLSSRHGASCSSAGSVSRLSCPLLRRGNGNGSRVVAGPNTWDADVGPLPVHAIDPRMTEEERGFWQQPDSGGYRPCIQFSVDYRKDSARVAKEKTKFLMVVVTGGLNQQRNEIIDAVVIARILEAALVLPILQVNRIWEDESEFSDIFDAEHFKRTLASDVHVVAAVPYTHLHTRPTFGTQLPSNASPLWIRTKYQKQLNKNRILLLNGLHSRLSKNLPLNLQKLRCKVAFHALRFVAPIREVGNRLARRMWERGPYIALHLRMEKDVWVRTGCFPSLGPDYDTIIATEREFRPEFLTGKLNMSYQERKLAGFCPLTGQEVAGLLRALGAPRSALIYRAGGEPFGGEDALQPLREVFPNLIDKEMLALEGELEPFANSSSALAAIDYIVSLSSDVFMPSHGGNMARSLQGHRAYAGHRKFIKPNKRGMVPVLSPAPASEAQSVSEAAKHLHKGAVGVPERRTEKGGRDVIAYPVPECMCRRVSLPFFLRR